MIFCLDGFLSIETWAKTTLIFRPVSWTAVARPTSGVGGLELPDYNRLLRGALTRVLNNRLVQG